MLLSFYILVGLGILLSFSGIILIAFKKGKKGCLSLITGLAIVYASVYFMLGEVRPNVGIGLPGSFPFSFGKTGSKPEQKTEAESTVLAELAKREASLRARKAALNPKDTAGILQLRADVFRYNEDLKAATGQELVSAPSNQPPTAPAVPAAPAPPAPPSKIAAAIYDELVIQKGGQMRPINIASLASVRFYAVYFSAEWCPPCRGFTPELVAWYNKNKAANPNFELIFVSRDRSAADMAHYMSADGMPWPAVAWDKIRSTPLGRYAGSGIPCLVFMDSSGKVLSDTYVNGNYRGPQAVVSEMTQKLSAAKGLAQTR